MSELACNRQLIGKSVVQNAASAAFAVVDVTHLLATPCEPLLIPQGKCFLSRTDDDRRMIHQDRRCFNVQEDREMKAIRAVIAACIFVLGVSIPQTYTNSVALHAQDLTPTTHDHLVVQGCVNIPPGQKRPDFGCFSLATESGLRFSRTDRILASANVSESSGCTRLRVQRES